MCVGYSLWFGTWFLIFIFVPRIPTQIEIAYRLPTLAPLQLGTELLIVLTTPQEMSSAMGFHLNSILSPLIIILFILNTAANNHTNA